METDKKRFRTTRMSQKSNSGNVDPVMWSDVASRILMNAVCHPIEYAKVLIQLGYEPIPPKPTTTLFGKPALKLPNVFAYIKHIKNVDGFTGCYRGLMPKLCSYTVSIVACDKTLEYLQKNSPQDNNEDEEDERVRCKKCMREIIWDIISRTVAIIVSHPLEVVSLRMMAQFVGGEKQYSSLLGSLLEIYRENGILGYYAGVVPRIIGSAAVILIAGVSTYAINNYVIQEQTIKPYTSSLTIFLATTATYPFLVVSHCMAVNNCGLMAGLPPHMPVYKNWVHCWAHLSAHNQLKRGSSMLWRYYTGPHMLLNGKLIPIMGDNFYQPSP
ncbi:mitochondrial carrier homolog 2-like isoform X1 [Pseudomyrmex gracilis]|uniref:mitochondrial carrier homolog 2-like isoform X1 n=2 Tax=Pseudomyrmex gracilis TaxID=219809 RepID=UPI0009958EE0|nr:mitochondrial carrier homolog 2-like isoform X1 [Pseudomyrmex gracilis]XP_020298046.1 mitochondrial carrier homolog 2-like isoform X1 [Pseudomyrmex gracilis]XP_020298047.1 mitochondrial carrier homolog 2-like isoform X1 [Pseudomyrmex gracilis]XP_020298048.1 mitochondrial carrier homolog 2-like isoform X1 [Pseudomyrmex gracilis]XP_020298050.1 mitochondrial carrier homolog 2-like isoform X1 [Pseudomyrmex gracilis]